jgi:ligand-binding sensor domain-containing protein/serine phosphatase RsbU (regulator of sigma subunit)
LSISQYTIDDGLSQTSVNCIIQDSKGFIWAGTQDGLNKFDGYSFKTYKYDPANINSLSNNFVNCIIEDASGNIWIGTDEGLNKLDIYTNKITRYLIDPGNVNTIPQNEIYDLYQDKQGYLWIKTENFLSRFDTEKEKFRHYEHYNDVFNFTSVNDKFSIFEDHKGQLWVGTKDGLNYFDRKLEIFKRYKHDPNDSKSLSNNKVKVVYEDKQNNLWIGTNDGLNLFNWETEQFERFYSNNNDDFTISNNTINDIYEDNGNNLWVATDNGLNKYDRNTKKFTTYAQFFNDYQIVHTTSFTSIMQDNTGILWAGSFQGLLKIKNVKKKFKLYDKDQNNIPYFSNNYIISIFEQDGIVWVGTWGAGLYHFNPVTKEKKSFNTENSNIVNDFIHKIYKLHNGNIWIGTQNGINVYNAKTRKFDILDTIDIFKTFKNNRIYDIIEDHNKNIWVGSKYGLYQILEDTIISYLHDESDTLSISSNEIYDILEDSDNNIWAATKRGLNKLNRADNSFKRYIRPEGACENCLSSNEILYLLEDTTNHCLWIATVWGLNRFALDTEQIKVYTENDGLPNNLIYAILPDDSGNIWLSTNRGLSKFNPSTNEFSNFGVADGLQDFEFNHGAYYKSESGELFFGGIEGYNSFYPDSITKNTKVPEIQITSVELLTSKFSGKVAIGKDNLIEVPHKNNLLTIEFSALDFTNPQKNNYAYKLEGAENEWINLGTRRYATFSNLPSGKYVFRVKGSNSDNVWNEEGTSFRIMVLTPIWQTKLAFATYIIAFLALVFWFFQYRTRSLRKSNHELKEKERIAKQVAIQKDELTVKNKSITDSIVYAKRIQEALLPSMNLFKKLLPSSFVLHKPKDIVSGDFYWINEKNGKIFVAVVDCTGHGVPGAFMSIIGFELLRKITDDLGIETADEILQHLNDGVAITFGKTTENVRLKDGMDIALCVIDMKKGELEFAGAFRPLYFIRENKIEEIRGDRFSVGLMDEGEAEKITKTIIKLKKDDVFYLFSDGYADQFGGTEGKKYKYRRFRHILLTIHKLPLEQQKTYLSRSFDDWKGNLEQVDDVLILGFKPDLNQ